MSKVKKEKNMREFKKNNTDIDETKVHCIDGYDAFDVAEYVLEFCEKELSNPITNEQLQKILYYIQGEYIALYGEAIFENIIEAWDVGPVIPDVYCKYSDYLSAPITGIRTNRELFEEDKELVAEIAKSKSFIEIDKLTQMIKNEFPWRCSYERGKKNEIPIEVIRDYFAYSVREEEIEIELLDDDNEFIDNDNEFIDNSIVLNVDDEILEGRNEEILVSNQKLQEVALNFDFFSILNMGIKIKPKNVNMDDGSFNSKCVAAINKPEKHFWMLLSMFLAFAIFDICLLCVTTPNSVVKIAIVFLEIILFVSLVFQIIFCVYQIKCIRNIKKLKENMSEFNNRRIIISHFLRDIIEASNDIALFLSKLLLIYVMASIVAKLVFFK
jgi:uncharacterized phage-associated protein